MILSLELHNTFNLKVFEKINILNDQKQLLALGKNYLYMSVIFVNKNHSFLSKLIVSIWNL